MTLDRRQFTLGALAAACAHTSCSRATRRARAPTPGRESVTVVSYNVNFGIPGDRDTLAAMAQSDADLVALQETTPAWERAIRATLSARYAHMAFKHCCRAGGLALLSKRPFASLDYLKTTHGWFPAWRLRAQSPIGDIELLMVHLRPPLSDSGSVVSGYVRTPAIRRAEIEEHLGALELRAPTLIVGDFNEDDDGRALAYLTRQGLRSVLPEFQPAADTWRWKLGPTHIHARLDHIVYSPKLDPLQAWVIEAGRSDHLPVAARFELRA